MRGYEQLTAKSQAFAAALEARPTSPYFGCMSDPRRRLGKLAEDLVAARVTSLGWEILARNSRTRLGEIDLIAREGTCLVFLEVKAGRAGSFFGPERPSLAVGSRKQARLRRLAREWLAANRPPLGCSQIRFDVVGITYDSGDRPLDYEHIESAF